MPTVPEACPRCRASGQVFVWAMQRPPGAWSLPFWHLHVGVGYLRAKCSRCRGTGAAVMEANPPEDPAEWAHRILPGVGTTSS